MIGKRVIAMSVSVKVKSIVLARQSWLGIRSILLDVLYFLCEGDFARFLHRMTGFLIFKMCICTFYMVEEEPGNKGKCSV